MEEESSNLRVKPVLYPEQGNVPCSSTQEQCYDRHARTHRDK